MSPVSFNLDKKAQQLNGVTRTPSKPLYKSLVSPQPVGPNGTPIHTPRQNVQIVRMPTPQRSPSTPEVRLTGQSSSPNAQESAQGSAQGTAQGTAQGAAPPAQGSAQGGTRKLVPANPKPRRKYDYSAYKSHDFSRDEMTQLLEKYVEVPQTQWANLPRGTHVRYMKKDGKFARGGFIKNTYMLRGKQTMQLETGNDTRAPGYTQFPVVLENISNLWRLDPAKEPNAPQVSNVPFVAPVQVPVVPATPLQKNVVDGVVRMETMDQMLQLELELREAKSRIDSQEEQITKLKDAVRRIISTLTQKFGAQKSTPSPHPSANGQR